MRAGWEDAGVIEKALLADPGWRRGTFHHVQRTVYAVVKIVAGFRADSVWDASHATTGWRQSVNVTTRSTINIHVYSQCLDPTLLLSPASGRPK